MKWKKDSQSVIAHPGPTCQFVSCLLRISQYMYWQSIDSILITGTMRLTKNDTRMKSIVLKLSSATPQIIY